MTMLPAAILIALLAALAALHFYWAFGGRRGLEAAVPTRPPETSTSGNLSGSPPLFTPGPAATAAVGFALLAAAVLVLAVVRSVVLPVSDAVLRGGVWLLAAVFLLRAVGDFRYVGLFKRVRGTRFAHLDTRVYTPLCLVLSALAVWVAVSTP